MIFVWLGLDSNLVAATPDSGRLASMESPLAPFASASVVWHPAHDPRLLELAVSAQALFAMLPCPVFLVQHSSA